MRHPGDIFFPYLRTWQTYFTLFSFLSWSPLKRKELKKKKGKIKIKMKQTLCNNPIRRNEGPWKLTGAPWMDSPFGPWGPGGPCGPEGPISPGGPWGPLNIKFGHYLNKHNLIIKSSWIHCRVYFPQYNYVMFQAYHQPGCWNKLWMPCSLLLHQECNNQGSKRHSSQSSLWQTSYRWPFRPTLHKTLEREI